MPARRSCSFCGNEIEPGTGKMFIRKDGTVFLFCSHKCQTNLLKLRRVPRWTPWTQAFRRAAGRAVEEAPAVVVAEQAPGTEASEIKIEAPKGRDIPADLRDLIDKRLGPDLPRGEIERFYTSFLGSAPFRTSIVGWAKKKHGAKPMSHIEKPEFLAWKDSPEGRRVFKAWLDGQWQQVKGRKVEAEEPEEEAPAPTAKKAKKGA